MDLKESNRTICTRNKATVKNTLFSYGNKSYSAKAHVTRQKLTEQKGYLRCIYARKCS